MSAYFMVYYYRTYFVLVPQNFDLEKNIVSRQGWFFYDGSTHTVFEDNYNGYMSIEVKNVSGIEAGISNMFCHFQSVALASHVSVAIGISSVGIEA